MILTGETGVLGEKHYTASVVDEWMSMQHWWNDTDRGSRSTGRKTLYSLGGRWMNEWMNMEHWWNDTDRRKPKYWEKNLSQRHLVHDISHGLAWDRAWAFAVTDRRLTVWIKARPLLKKNFNPYYMKISSYRAVNTQSPLWGQTC
jgi:hypothetical protein